MIFQINILRKELSSFIDELKNNDYKIYGTHVQNGSIISKIKPSTKYAIIMGSEGLGVKKELLSKCNTNIYIPMNTNCESLNVGVATSIILYEFNKETKSSEKN